MSHEAKGGARFSFNDYLASYSFAGEFGGAEHGPEDDEDFEFDEEEEEMLMMDGPPSQPLPTQVLPTQLTPPTQLTAPTQRLPSQLTGPTQICPGTQTQPTQALPASFRTQMSPVVTRIPPDALTPPVVPSASKDASKKTSKPKRSKLKKSKKAKQASPPLRPFLFEEPAEGHSSAPVITLPDGRTLHTKWKPRANSKSATDLRAHARSAQHGLLSIPIQDMMNEIEAEERKASEESAVEENRSSLPSSSKGAFVDVYRPKIFADLISDERTNCDVLRWLKSWEDLVFSGKSDSAPEQRMLLLCGSPGTGKTTLAHVLAEHSGYRPVEINASDDRTAKVLRSKLRNAMEMRSVFGDKRPNCIILDEIDGAVGASEGSNTMSALISFATKSATRPIICVCNDVYASCLRQLRRCAMVVNMRTVDPHRLLQRLSEISRNEGITCPTSALSTLCMRTRNDIRECLNILELAKRSETPKMSARSVIESAANGCKDSDGSLWDVWTAVFSTPKEKMGVSRRGAEKRRKDHKQAVFNKIMGFCLDGAMLHGIHENMTRSRALAIDPTMRMLSVVAETMCEADIYLAKTMSGQRWDLLKYVGACGMNVHSMCAQTAKMRVHFPTMFTNFKSAASRRRGILTDLVSGFSKNRGVQNASQIATEMLSPLRCILAPPTIRPLPFNLMNSGEKDEVDRLVGIMQSLSMTFRVEPASAYSSDKKFAYEPPFDELVDYSDAPVEESYHALATSTCGIVAQKIKHQNMRGAVVGKTESSANAADAPQASVVSDSEKRGLKRSEPEEGNTVARDFFGRRVVHADSGSKKKMRKAAGLLASFRFKEGFTNAVRRAVSLEEFL